MIASRLLPRFLLAPTPRRLAESALAVVGSGALAFTVEQSIIEGGDGFAGARWLALVGVGSGVALGFLMSVDIRIGWVLGVHVHLFAGRVGRPWRRRHEVEHAVMAARVSEMTRHACVTAMSSRDFDPAAPSWGRDVERLADALLDSVAIGAALMPGCRRVRVLAAGDYGALSWTAHQASASLADWEVSLLADRRDSPEDPFIDYEVELGGPHDGPPQAVNRALFIQVGNIETSPAEEYSWRTQSESCFCPREATPRLEETSAAYGELADCIGRSIPPAGSMDIGFAGPASMAFAAGLIAGRRPGLAMTTLRFDGAEKRYHPDSPVVRAMPSAVPPVRDQHLRGWLFGVGAGAATCATLALGDFVTLLEWSLASSNPDATTGQWGALVGLIVVPAVLAVLLGLVRRRIQSPAAHVSLNPDRRRRPRVWEVHVKPRRYFANGNEALDWLQEALMDISSVHSQSKIVLDIEGVPHRLLAPLGNFLARGFRGGAVRVSALGHTVALSELSAAPENLPEPFAHVGRGYKAGVSDTEWERPGGLPFEAGDWQVP